MNNRDYKQFAPESYYHIYNRGNGKMNIFLDEQDFTFFLFRLKEGLYPEKIIHQESKKERYVRTPLPHNAFTLLCYCIMPNHFHLLIKQNSDTSLSKLISKICTSYGKYFNKKYGRIGGVFQDQFKSIVVDKDSYFTWLSAYIHKNPLEAGIVKNLYQYPYSSYLDYAGLRRGSLCDQSLILDMFENDRKQYETYVLDASLISQRSEKMDSFTLDD